MNRLVASALFAVASVTAAACAAPSAEDDPTLSGDSAVVQQRLDARTVASAIGKLDAVRNGERIGTYYTDGVRVEGCWKNPAGNKLTELKKAYYCSYPLEFRLCNTVVLLTVDEADVDGRYAGYVKCKDRVSAILGDDFRFDAEVDAVYRRLYLEGAKIDGVAGVVDASRPEDSGRSFPVLLAGIAKSLVTEGVDLGISAAMRSLGEDLEKRSAPVK